MLQRTKVQTPSGKWGELAFKKSLRSTGGLVIISPFTLFCHRKPHRSCPLFAGSRCQWSFKSCSGNQNFTCHRAIGSHFGLNHLLCFFLTSFGWKCNFKKPQFVWHLATSSLSVSETSLTLFPRLVDVHIFPLRMCSKRLRGCSLGGSFLLHICVTWVNRWVMC